MEENPKKTYRLQVTARILHGKDPIDKAERTVEFHDETKARLWMARLAKMAEAAQNMEEKDGGQGQTDEGGPSSGD